MLHSGGMSLTRSGRRAAAILIAACAAVQSVPPATAQEISMEAEREGDFITFTASAELKVDRKIAWQVLSDYDHLAEFIPDMQSSRIVLRTSDGAMIEQKGGRIINLSSQLAQRAVGGGGFAAYAATKGAIESLTRALASEVGQLGITVNAIAPGGIETDMSRDVMTEEYRARRLAELPLRRFGRVEDVAYCALILAADDAGYLTGQILHPSGGWVSG